MVFYDFKIRTYFEGNQFLVAMINYARKSLNKSKKEMQQDTNTSHATYRRAELANFDGYMDMLVKLADYFALDTEVSSTLIDEIEHDFNLLYTYTYFNDLDMMAYYYDKIDARKSECEKNILLSIVHFAKVIYFTHSPKRMELKEIKASLDILQYFQGDMLDIFEFLLDDYMFNFHALSHDKQTTMQYAKNVYLKAFSYPRLVPFILFQMSLNYYFINDYANAIYYSLEALPKLEKDLNYARSLNGNLNIAICFERLHNTVQAKEILNKIFLHLVIKKDERIAFLSHLTMANCYVTDQEYDKAVVIFQELEETRDIKGENSLMLLYCYYKIPNKVAFDKLADHLIDEYEKERFYVGYYEVVLLFKQLQHRNRKAIYQRFKASEQAFIPFKDSKIVDLIYYELREKKIIPSNYE